MAVQFSSVFGDQTATMANESKSGATGRGREETKEKARARHWVARALPILGDAGYPPRFDFVVALICRSYPFGVVVW